MGYIIPEDLYMLGYQELPDTNVKSDICEAVTTIIDNYCLQPISSTAYDGIINIKLTKTTGYNKIFVPFLPIISITSISSVYSMNESTLITASNYRINNNLGCIEIETTYYDDLQVLYTHGYETIPDAIKRAALHIASKLISDINKREQIKQDGVIKIKDNQLEITYDAKLIDSIPNPAKELLMNYRRIR